MNPTVTPAANTPVSPPMRVSIPEDGGLWPDVEEALVTLLNEMLADLTPHGVACIIPPQNYADLVHAGHPIVTVQRSGGAADGVFDHPNVYISVTTAYRSDSWDVLGWLRLKLRDYSGVVTNPDGSQAIIAGIADMRGPQKAPALSNDTNQVSAAFTVTTRLGR